MKHAKKTATGLGVAGMMAIALLIKPWEGRVHKPYRDIGGVWTVCDGHTGPDIVIDKIYSDPECDNVTARDVRTVELAVEGKLKRSMPVPTKAAFISFAYNVGVTAFQNSTLLKMANAGDLRGACEQLPRWVFVKGTFVAGLKNRRMSERSLCLQGLDPNFRPPAIENFVGWVIS
jgi:lysozyme